MRSIGGGPPSLEWSQLMRKVNELIKALDYKPLELAKIKEMAREIKEKLDRVEKTF